MESLLLLKDLIEFVGTGYLVLIASGNFATIFMDRIRLIKVSKYDGCFVNGSPILDSRSTEEIKKKWKEEQIRNIFPLIEKLESSISKENLKSAYQNISTLKIKKNVMISFIGLGAQYITKTNTIRYKRIEDLGHEILHVASSFYDSHQNISFTGFEQESGSMKIGTSINEGYTELLTTRIYRETKARKAYKKEVNLARLLELFFDDPKKMEDFYFHHDLPKMIKHLETYDSRANVIQWIAETDRISFFRSTFWSPIPTYSYIKAQLTLHKWFVEKNPETEKLQKFQEIVKEDPLTSLLLSRQKIKIQRKSNYEDVNTEINSNKKI